MWFGDSYDGIKEATSVEQSRNNRVLLRGEYEMNQKWQKYKKKE